jgi:hypothetical protein
MSKSIKVRFNLGKGKNYMKWKVQYPDGTVSYYNPTDLQLVMHDCVFKNYKSTAQKIFDGGEKVVCAWVLCKEIDVHPQPLIKDESTKVRYNPRVQPNWLLDGEIMDNKTAVKLHTIDYGVYITSEK